MRTTSKLPLALMSTRVARAMLYSRCWVTAQLEQRVGSILLSAYVVETDFTMLKTADPLQQARARALHSRTMPYRCVSASVPRCRGMGFVENTPSSPVEKCLAAPAPERIGSMLVGALR